MASWATAGRRWQLQDAKNRFGELVVEAQRNGPQVVMVRGKEAAIVLGDDEYQRLVRRKSIVDVLLSAPRIEGGLELERSRDLRRDPKLG
jgi:prevent-host-death family protein